MTETTELRNVRITTEADDSGSDMLADYLGTFCDEPGPANRTIDRAERGTQGRAEHQYFVAEHSPEETGNPESVEQDWRRAESYGETWSHIGIRAEATVFVNGVRQTVRSGGLWGIETDASESYIAEVASEQVDELYGILSAIGVDTDDVSPEWDTDRTIVPSDQ